MDKKNYFLKNYKASVSDPGKDDKDNIKSNDKKVEQKKNYFEKLETKETLFPSKISKKRLTAIYFILLGTEDASKIMKHLNEDEISTITNEILKISEISENDILEINDNFGKIDKKKISRVNGKEFSRELLHKSFGVDKGSKYFIKCIEEVKKEARSLAFVETIPSKQIVDILSRESDAVNVIILGMITPKKAAEILKLFPKDKSVEILKKISKGSEVNPEIYETIVKKLKDKVAQSLENEHLELKGKDKLVEILKYSSYDKSLNIIDSLEEVSPDLAKELREKIFTFGDIINIPKKSLDAVLKDFSDEDIAFMLKGASDEIRNVFFKSVTKKRREIIKEEIDFLGMVKKKDVDEKRGAFVGYIRDMEREGKIVLNPDNEVYVE